MCPVLSAHSVEPTRGTATESWPLRFRPCCGFAATPRWTRGWRISAGQRDGANIPPIEFRIRAHIVGGWYAHPAGLVDLLGVAGSRHAPLIEPLAAVYTVTSMSSRLAFRISRHPSLSCAEVRVTASLTLAGASTQCRCGEQATQRNEQQFPDHGNLRISVNQRNRDQSNDGPGIGLAARARCRCDRRSARE